MQQRNVSSQSQVPGGPTPAGCASAGTGRLLPDATLPTASGTSMSLDWYSGRRNLVVVLLGAPAPDDEVARLLSQLAQGRAALRDEEAEVLVVAAGAAGDATGAPKGPYTMLIDPDASFHRCMSAMDSAGDIAPAVVITDRFREIYHTFRPPDPPWPPTVEEVVSWLVFMNIQCPECGAPEW